MREGRLCALEAVEAAVARYVAVNEEKLGRKGRAAELLTSRGSFVANDELARLRAMTASLAAAHPGADMARLRQAIDALGLISLERLVSGSVDALASLAAELKKPAPAVDLINGEFGFNNQFAEALKSSFVHLMRNSLDHGIETPEERRAVKPEQGQVRFSCVQRAGTVELRISDDGRGLPLHRLYEMGLAAGLFDAARRPTRQEVAELIFRSGLSTAAAVTQVSGRGVGMDAVRTFLEQQGATIRIELNGSGTELDYTPFEFVIEAASTACAHSRAVAA
jgi:chemotaxis protein histidine kinase CheA